MGKIINKKNVEIIVDGLELLKKYLQQITPINTILTMNIKDSKYTVDDIDTILKEINQSTIDEN
jgi:wyosine [tRNA(Phe)-imidazoG37] synthetase (radical SAM superfamily)